MVHHYNNTSNPKTKYIKAIENRKRSTYNSLSYGLTNSRVFHMHLKPDFTY
eukprot:m.62583 g.62583  ORF g.62583 m.62583 type:complete len:51 (+) comp23173_c0_seq2:36-188(+)